MSLRDQVQTVMSDGVWRTSFELRLVLLERFRRHASDAGITAKLRDLRKPRFGGYAVESRRRPNMTTQVWEYKFRG